MNNTAKKLFSLLSALLILGFFCKNVIAKSVPVHQAKKRLHSFMRTYVKRNNIPLPAGKLFDYLNQGSQLINEETNNGLVDSQRISFIENNFRDFIKAEYPVAPTAPRKKIQQPRRYQTTNYKKKTTKPYKAKKNARYNYKKKQLTPKKRYVPKQRRLKKKYYKAKHHKHNVKKQHKPKQRKTKAKTKPYLPKKSYKKTSKKRSDKKRTYRPKKSKTNKKYKPKHTRKKHTPKKRNPKNYRKPQRHAPNETTISYAEIKVRRNISKARVPRKERLRVFNSIMQKIRAQSRDGKVNRNTLKAIIERELSTYRAQKRTTPIRPKRRKDERRVQPRKKTKPRKVTPTTQILNRYQA